MASIIDLSVHRARRLRPVTRRRATAAAPNMVTCLHCGEQHPIIRLRGGEERCVTAFFDGSFWFCRNRGCRRAWLSNHPSR
jgi:hypothetical protein